MSIIGIIVSIISASYYLKVIRILHQNENTPLRSSKGRVAEVRSLISSSTNNLEAGKQAGCGAGEEIFLSSPDAKNLNNKGCGAVDSIVKSNSNVESKNLQDKSSELEYESKISNFHSLIISILTLLILFFFLNPSILL
jgi:hypothetical protein